MHTPSQDSLAAVVRLRTVLEDAAAALAAADLDRLLATETALQGALDALPSVASPALETRPLVRRELEGASAALLQCRRLGATLVDFVRISIDARGEQLGYEPDPRAAAAALAGRGFSQRA